MIAAASKSVGPQRRCQNVVSGHPSVAWISYFAFGPLSAALATPVICFTEDNWLAPCPSPRRRSPLGHLRAYFEACF